MRDAFNSRVFFHILASVSRCDINSRDSIGWDGGLGGGVEVEGRVGRVTPQGVSHKVEYLNRYR